MIGYNRLQWETRKKSGRERGGNKRGQVYREVSFNNLLAIA